MKELLTLTQIGERIARAYLNMPREQRGTFEETLRLLKNPAGSLREVKKS